MQRQDTDFNEKFEEVWAESCTGGTIQKGEVKGALDVMGCKLPNHEVRELLDDLERQNKCSGGALSKEVFKEIAIDLHKKDQAKRKSWKVTGLQEEHVKVEADKTYGFHVVLKEEQNSFSDWINGHMQKIDSVKHLLPLHDEGDDLYTKIDDGIILCELINMAVPDTIDNRAINKTKNGKISLFKKHENLTLAINSAKSIGIQTINMDSHVLSEGDARKHIILGLIWQILAKYLLAGITLQNFPGLIVLLRDGETIEDLLKLSPEQILIRWVNYQLGKANCDRTISNFGEDIKDSIVYGNLIDQIAPPGSGVNKLGLQKSDLKERAEEVLKQADKIECREFVTPNEIVKGVEKLNLAFVANMFNKHPALEEPEEDLGIQETREEKMFRNWMNSLGVKPYVNYLYGDLYNGLVIFQLFDFIQPGIVDWKKRVTQEGQFSKMQAKANTQVLLNCCYAVELGKKMNFVLVGIEGNDIMQGNKMLTLALVWQLMRAYTLSLLAKLSPDGSPIVESEIISWANERMADKGCSIRHFKDKANADAVPVLHLIDSLKPGAIDWSCVKQGNGLGAADRMDNAKYAIAMARRIGAPVYALPEDLVEVNHKMVMTIYASLMYFDMS